MRLQRRYFPAEAASGTNWHIVTATSSRCWQFIALRVYTAAATTMTAMFWLRSKGRRAERRLACGYFASSLIVFTSEVPTMDPRMDGRVRGAIRAKQIGLCAVNCIVRKVWDCLRDSLIF
ncbi:hypothetical protein L596_012245 [Steinernema carpocapsae]|uniref:Uncharacterized protein n=1 Tax=Steinernema carpocapsae TaxID=34508 RepID=A0A4U5NWG9_STECR|nr:hypothetical protein L596_012245 [Steinernema carpocapsae]